MWGLSQSMEWGSADIALDPVRKQGCQRSYGRMPCVGSVGGQKAQVSKIKVQRESQVSVTGLPRRPVRISFDHLGDSANDLVSEHRRRVWTHPTRIRDRHGCIETVSEHE